MSANDTLSVEDKEFLAQCEEEFKDRFTDKDEEFMKILNAEPSTPPIVSPWWTPQNSGRQNDHRNNKRHRYEQHGGGRDRYGRRDHNNRRDQDRADYQDHRGYNDYGDRSYGYHNKRHRY
ncbi:RNA guanine-N7 methyltransferase activating subunit [Amyelois transitella]|uniref:RNA guanine-N7 methyltransferase activating subunit n=1 Tax=Amyelois transitella TaxID=680683 RepID=UPI00067D5DB0|nr:RNA guanine-N7 methyltransferase activating subunit [Amyelois transitella]